MATAPAACRCLAAASLWLAPCARAQAPDRHAGDLVLEPASIEYSGGAYAADRGHLWVPMDRARPGSPLIDLAFVRLRCTGSAPGAPLFYLSGGPGDQATPLAVSGS